MILLACFTSLVRSGYVNPHELGIPSTITDQVSLVGGGGVANSRYFTFRNTSTRSATVTYVKDDGSEGSIFFQPYGTSGHEQTVHLQSDWKLLRTISREARSQAYKEAGIY